MCWMQVLPESSTFTCIPWNISKLIFSELIYLSAAAAALVASQLMFVWWCWTPLSIRDKHFFTTDILTNNGISLGCLKYSAYCKNPKNQNTYEIPVIILKFEHMWFCYRLMHRNDADGMTSVEPHQTPADLVYTFCPHLRVGKKK